MSNVVGAKGQVVIEKQVRDRLGIGPGWETIQRVVDDHVEIRFVPPVHNRSLAGCLSHLVDRSRPAPTDEEMDAAVERGVLEDWLEKERRMRGDPGFGRPR